MGKRCMPCNLSPEEQKAAWEEFGERLTRGEEEEIMEEVLPNYLFYQVEGRNRRRCVCTHLECGVFEIDRDENREFYGLKHGDITKCPVCGGRVMLQAVGRLRTFRSLNDRKWKQITVCRTGKNGALLLMSGFASRFFMNDDLRPVPEVIWKARTYLLPGKRMQWFRSPIYGCGSCWGYQWVKNESVREPFTGYMGSDSGSFFIGAEAIIDDTCALRYCIVEQWLTDRFGQSLYLMEPLQDVVRYLACYTQYPTMEMAVRLGLHQAASDLVLRGVKNHRDLDWQAKNIQGFLRLCKADAKAFVQQEGTLEMLRAYHAAFRAGTVKQMGPFLAIVQEMKCENRVQTLVDCAGRAACSVEQAANYLRKQAQGNVDPCIILWRDYMDMAAQLEYDMSRRDVVMPKDLQDRHDAAAQTLRYMRKAQEEKQNKELNRRLEKMFAFRYGELEIVVPKSAQEIILEGKTLHHCVGGYAGRHFEGKVVILFLRHVRRPGRPFITIEVRPRKDARGQLTICQIHGYKNERYMKDLTAREMNGPQYKFRWFLDAWKDWVEAGSKRDRQGNPILTKSNKEKTA